MVSDRVAECTLSDAVDFFSVGGEDYILVPTLKGWKVYEDATGYSQVSGQVIKKGKVVRVDGKPVVFPTKEAAEVWSCATLTREYRKAERLAASRIAFAKAHPGMELPS